MIIILNDEYMIQMATAQMWVMLAMAMEMSVMKGDEANDFEALQQSEVLKFVDN